MPVVVRHNGKYYRIPDEVLSKSAVTKSRFETRLQELESRVQERAKTARHPRLMEFSEDEFDDAGSK